MATKISDFFPFYLALSFSTENTRVKCKDTEILQKGFLLEITVLALFSRMHSVIGFCSFAMNGPFSCQLLKM